MTFLEFIRSKGYTVKSLAEKTGIKERSLGCYTHVKKKYRWENTGLKFALSVADVLEIPAEKLLEFDDAEPEQKKEWKAYSSYNPPYQARRRRKEPQKWSIIKNGDFWYLVHDDDLEEWKREFEGAGKDGLQRAD